MPAKLNEDRKNKILTALEDIQNRKFKKLQKEERRKDEFTKKRNRILDLIYGNINAIQSFKDFGKNFSVQDNGVKFGPSNDTYVLSSPELATVKLYVVGTETEEGTTKSPSIIFVLQFPNSYRLVMNTDEKEVFPDDEEDWEDFVNKWIIKWIDTLNWI